MEKDSFNIIHIHLREIAVSKIYEKSLFMGKLSILETIWILNKKNKTMQLNVSLFLYSI